MDLFHGKERRWGDPKDRLFQKSFSSISFVLRLLVILYQTWYLLLTEPTFFEILPACFSLWLAGWPGNHHPRFGHFMCHISGPSGHYGSGVHTPPPDPNPHQLLWFLPLPQFDSHDLEHWSIDGEHKQSSEGYRVWPKVGPTRKSHSCFFRRFTR